MDNITEILNQLLKSNGVAGIKAVPLGIGKCLDCSLCDTCSRNGNMTDTCTNLGHSFMFSGIYNSKNTDGIVKVMKKAIIMVQAHE